ncbi:MAG: DUF6624 domain-containing protein [Chloroflexota bacterium]
MNTELRALRAELLAMQEADLVTRRRLIDAGELYGPTIPPGFYHPDMAAVHHQNNARLWEIVREYGWPGRALVGEEGCEAAWKIAQHAVLDPALQAFCVSLLEKAVAEGDAPGQHWAMLTDRVLMEKGEPQIYGSIFVGGADGGLVPWTIADPDQVEARRQAVGLPPLAEHNRNLQARVNLETQVQQAAQSDKKQSG